MTKNKFLFLTPSGGRTGSEMMLWYLLQNLEGSGIEAALYARQTGELVTQSPLAQSYSYPHQRGFLHQIYEGIYYQIFKQTPEEKYVERLHKRIKPDFWYLNTIVMPQFAALAQKLGVPYIVHAHELPQMYDDLKYQEFITQMTGAKLVIGCSKIVVERLRQMGLTNVALQYEFVNHALIQPQTDRQVVRQLINIPADAFVWAMSGTMALRKGFDMLPDLVKLLPKNHHFIWLGSPRDAGLRYYVEQRMTHENLNIQLLGAKTTDYYDYLNAADGFALLSREDPFPLVMMEAAYLQKPIVGFESGGVEEFVQPEMGVVVAGFDVKKMAQNMIAIADGTTTINLAKLQYRSTEFSVKNQVFNWLSMVREYIL
jgi:L-malate glycosyltransferase